MSDSGSRPEYYDVPPGSTAHRELLHAIDRALTLPAPASNMDPAYLLCLAERAAVVRAIIRTALAGVEAEREDRDTMILARRLDENVAELRLDYPRHGRS